MTTSTGAVAERYAYTAYGQPTILNASGSVLTSSAVGNRYTYTGREWDETLGLHHFRARWMSPLAGRFLGRDPIRFEGSLWNLHEFCDSTALNDMDPNGTDTIVRPPRKRRPRIPGGPPLPPGYPPPKVSYQQGLAGLDAIGPMIASMCSECCNESYCDCMGDAAKIRDALVSTWKSNYGYGPRGPNTGPGDDTVGGYFCWEWANMFYNAVTSLSLKSGCMSFHRMMVAKPPLPNGIIPIHAWLRISIGNGGTDCEANADDGWGNGSSSNRQTPLSNPLIWTPPFIVPEPWRRSDEDSHLPATTLRCD
jgi:RHS repeat-associated protein